jgi:1,4-alpha-glucan branching enzyme
MARPQIVLNDPWLEPFEGVIQDRLALAEETKQALCGPKSIVDYASGHHYFGCHLKKKSWVLREWAPNAKEIYLVGEMNDWEQSSAYRFKAMENGCWELKIPRSSMKHGQEYRLRMKWEGGSADRLPAWCKRAVQKEEDKSFNAQIWEPQQPYKWKNKAVKRGSEPVMIYEAHVGMAREEATVGTFDEFRRDVLPRIAEGGYNTVQLMAVQEHPYYGSFGYHVSNLFAVSSRFGSPEDLKRLVDDAHGLGLRVIMDLVHSHAVKNELEGISRYDGSLYQFFHDGPKGDHEAWDSRCYNYGKPEVLQFLLSNCRYWLEEFRFDGYRFDGVTSMLFCDHGLGRDFCSYGDYFGENQDPEAWVYMRLANEVIHGVDSEAISVAEDMSGMPGLACSATEGGLGFDYRLAMGTPDYWIKLIKDRRDEDWNVNEIFGELTNKRDDEKVISYAESHDQALVGDKTIVFRLIDKDMYTDMKVGQPNLNVERGVALHKMIRLLTAATAGDGYLNFMGNEFGHPEWIDFPREGNGWSHHYARRQWSLRDNEELRYSCLGDFDRDMVHLLLSERALEMPRCIPVLLDDSRKLLCFRRGPLLFAFNFNGTESYADLELVVSSDEFDLVLNSDAKAYDGFDRIEKVGRYRSELQYGQSFDAKILRIYLPSRTALVFRG